MILEAESSIREPEQPKELKEFREQIEYKGVTFSYNESKQVLKGINLVIPKGKTVALARAIGLGKKYVRGLVCRASMTCSKEASPSMGRTFGNYHSSTCGSLWEM